MLGIFVRSWKGQESLAKAFWLVYALFGIIVGIVIALIFMLTVPNFDYATYNNTIMAVGFPYTLFSAICVWRCAKNSHIVWNILAKIVVVLGVIGGIASIIQMLQGQ